LGILEHIRLLWASRGYRLVSIPCSPSHFAT
jgi:hypothetical protein